MKKTLLLPPLALLSCSAVLAGGKGYPGFYVYKGLALLVGAFLFSVIFWWTYLWIVQDKGKLVRKKR